MGLGRLLSSQTEGPRARANTTDARNGTSGNDMETSERNMTPRTAETDIQTPRSACMKAVSWHLYAFCPNRCLARWSTPRKRNHSTGQSHGLVRSISCVALSSISLPGNTTSKCGFMLRRTPYTSIQLLSINLNNLSTYSGTDMATRRRDRIRRLCSKAWAKPFLSISQKLEFSLVAKLRLY